MSLGDHVQREVSRYNSLLEDKNTNEIFSLTTTYTYVPGVYLNFPDFFRMDTFIDNTHMKL